MNISQKNLLWTPKTPTTNLSFLINKDLTIFTSFNDSVRNVTNFATRFVQKKVTVLTVEHA